ncbi:hypothetical protein BDZ94DRAFT_1233818 [Collybia nuda]|uniref:Uncharacterized protein n=1 Tax=Collybia nuda TaxID=64659 RepID=A0A9P5YAX9_9AGAR|nr:hypothetical protein BDZ94DRAFT_1233818 [Collybia nuda]
MPSLLGLKRGAQGGSSTVVRSGIKDKDVNTADLEPTVGMKETGVTPPPSRPSKDGKDVENNVRPQTSSKPLQKSRTIIRIISTKFRSRSPPPTSPTSPRSPKRIPVAPSDLISKENREAALRERGLLPPLKPNKDLSVLEQEQDEHIPVVSPADEGRDAAKHLTAANLVKQEWEAKNRPKNLDVTQRERMNTFKFGGLSSPAPSINEEKPQVTELDTVVEVDTPLPSPLDAIGENNQQLSAPEQLNNSEASMSSPLLRSNSILHTPEPGAETADEELSLTLHRPATPTKMTSEPHLIPLPPSPHRPRSSTMESDSDVVPTRLFAAAIPLPQSPNPTVMLDLSLQENISYPITEDGPTENISLSPSHNHTHSFPSSQPMSESGSDSITTPSLEATSQTMTISTLSTSELSPNVTRGKPNNMLKVKVHDHSIPIIIESPVEETLIKDSITGIEVIHDEPESTELGITNDDEDGTHTSSPPGTRLGGLADLTPPKEGVNRRKSINPFKRSQTLEPSNAPGSLTRRLSMAASINNIRRSVVGSLTRPKSSINTGPSVHKAFDASHLPPSPTIPTAFLEEGRSPTSPISPTRTFFSSSRSPVPETSAQPRQAVSPVIHSRGTILQETNNIEDEESRRMTELAFLG